MTRCSAMAELLQAYADGQSSPDDEARVEVHIRECPDCALKLSELHDLTEMVVAKLAPARVSTTFVDRVIAALPHMYEHVPDDSLAEINKRAKTLSRRHRFGQMVPYAGAAVLLIAFLLLLAVWPQEPLGRIVKVTNSAELVRSVPADTGRVPLAIGDAIFADDTLVADSSARIFLSLTTAQIKLNGDSMLRVLGNRAVELIKGEMCADVMPTGVPFRVKLSSGEVTVTGTRFVVQAFEAKTVVTVDEGQVLFKSGGGYSEIDAGAQSISFAGEIPSQAEPVDVRSVTRWADEFVVTPEDVAMAHHRRATLPVNWYSPVSRARGELIHTETRLFADLPSSPYVVRYLTVNRDAFGSAPQLPVKGHFAIYIYDADMKPLATIKDAYSMFDGSDEVAVLPMPHPVTIHDDFFWVIFQPHIDSDEPTSDRLERTYASLPGNKPRLIVEALSVFPTQEGKNNTSQSP